VTQATLSGFLTGRMRRTSGTRRRSRRSVLLYMSLAWLALLVLLAILAPVLPLGSYTVYVGMPRQHPFHNIHELLGTDAFGRSVLARMVYGARESLVVGLLASVIGMSIGGSLGLITGFFKGKVDRVMSLVVDTLLAFPPLVVLLMLASIFQPSITTIVLSLSFLSVPTFIRLERAATLVWVDRPFVQAARAYGASRTRLLVREVLPNAILPLVTYMPTVVAGLMIAEGSLSFLGLGIPPPHPSWGGMINDGRSQLRTDPQLVVVPAVAVFMTVLSLNELGHAIRNRYELGRVVSSGTRVV
jgi:peptide/nickel transport system permease protein